MNQIRLPDNILLTLSEAIQSSSPHEICAFLLINKNGDFELVFVKNYARTIDSFQLSPVDVGRTYRHAKVTEQEVAAFIHSHKRELELSTDDSRSFESSDIPWIVVIDVGGRVSYKIHQRQ